MSSLTFNQFTQKLSEQGIDKRTAYFLSLLYEAQIEQVKQIDATVTIVSALVDTVRNFADLNEQTQKKLLQLRAEIQGEYSGVGVHSVTTEPEKH